jgi:PAS domain S-box-containing protein
MERMDTQNERSTHAGDEPTTDAGFLLEECINGIGDAVLFAVDREYRYLYFNVHYERLLDIAYGTAPVCGASLLETIRNDEDRRKNKSNIDLALSGTAHVVVEEYGTGVRNFFEIRYTPIRSAAHDVIGVTVMAVNINDRLAAGKALLVSEERFNAFMDASPAIAWVTDMDGHLQYVNKAWESAYGLTRDEVKGKTAFECFPADVAVQLRKADLDVKINTDHHHMQESHFTIGEKQYHWESYKFQFRTSGGQHLLGGIGIDVSSRKRAEESLAESRKELAEHAMKLEYAMQTAHMAWWEMDVATGAVTFNESKVRMLGYQPEQFTHYRDFTTLLHPADYDPVMQAMRAHLDGITDSYEADYRILSKVGGYLWFRDSGRVTSRDAHGAPMKVTGIVIDITESKRQDQEQRDLERQLIHAQRMQSMITLASGVAHDFNTIFSVITSNADILLSTHDDGERRRRRLDAIIKASERGRNVVRQLQAVAGKSEIQHLPVDVNGVILDLSELLEATFPRSIVVEKVLAQNLPSIAGDFNQLHQALLNLSLNARDAMPDGGTIGFATAVIPGADLRHRFPRADAVCYVVASVKDNGCGMDEATQKRIFDPFFTTKGNDQAMGLGLSVTHGIVEGHKGFVDVISAPGAGSNFVLYLPCDENECPV